MANVGVAHYVADWISKVLDIAEPGQTEIVDFKGSEVRLKDGSILDCCR